MKSMSEILREAQEVNLTESDDFNLYEGNEEIGREYDYPVTALTQDDFDDGIGRYVITLDVDGKEVKMIQDRQFISDGDVYTHDVVDMMFDILDPQDMWTIICHISTFVDGDRFEDVIEREKLDEGVGDFVKNKMDAVGSHLSGKSLAKKILKSNNMLYPKYFTTVGKTAKERGLDLLKRIFSRNGIEKQDRELAREARKSVKSKVSVKLGAITRTLLKTHKNPFLNPIEDILYATYPNNKIVDNVMSNNTRAFADVKKATNKFRSMVAQAFEMDKNNPPMTEAEDYAARLSQHEQNRASSTDRPTASEVVDPLSIKPNSKVPTEATFRQIVTIVMQKPKQYPITHGYLLAYQEWLRRVFKQMGKVLIDQITDNVMVEDFEKIMGYYQSRSREINQTRNNSSTSGNSTRDSFDVAAGDNYGSRF